MLSFFIIIKLLFLISDGLLFFLNCLNLVELILDTSMIKYKIRYLGIYYIFFLSGYINVINLKSYILIIFLNGMLVLTLLLLFYSLVYLVLPDYLDYLKYTNWLSRLGTEIFPRIPLVHNRVIFNTNNIIDIPIT